MQNTSTNWHCCRPHKYKRRRKKISARAQEELNFHFRIKCFKDLTIEIRRHIESKGRINTPEIIATEYVGFYRIQTLLVIYVSWRDRRLYHLRLISIIASAHEKTRYCMNTPLTGLPAATQVRVGKKCWTLHKRYASDIHQSGHLPDHYKGSAVVPCMITEYSELPPRNSDR